MEGINKEAMGRNNTIHLTDGDFWEITRLEQGLAQSSDANKVLAHYDISGFRNKSSYVSFKNMRGVTSVTMDNLNVSKFVYADDLFKYCEDLRHVSLRFPSLKPKGEDKRLTLFDYCDNIETCELSLPKLSIQETYNLYYGKSPMNFIVECRDGVSIKVSIPELNGGYICLSNTSYDNINHVYDMTPNLFVVFKNDDSSDGLNFCERVWEKCPVLRPVVGMFTRNAGNRPLSVLEIPSTGHSEKLTTQQDLMFARTYLRYLYMAYAKKQYPV